MEFAYLGGILFGITGLALLDWRYKLVFWYNFKRSAATLSVAVALFILWDFFGISLDIFKHGGSPYSLPFTLFPEFPIEEIFFLFLICYSTLVIFNGVSKWRSRI